MKRLVTSLLLSGVLCGALCRAGLAQTNAGASAGADSPASRVVRQLADSPGDRDLLDMLAGALKAEANINLRNRLEVAYCLGCYYVGRDADAEAAKAAIVRSSSGLEFVRYLSAQFTKETCGACQGRGTVTGPCAACGGSGKCALCEGRGYRMMAGLNNVQKKAACPRCHGNGQCATCDGSAKSTSPCASCGGDGQKTARDKVKRVYVALLKGEPVDDAAFQRASPAAPAPAQPSTTAEGTAPPPRPAEHPALSHDTTPSRPAVSPLETQKEMDRYVSDMGALDQLFEQGKFESGSITEVQALPDRYVGKLIQTRAYIISCFAREVVVAARSSAARSEGIAMIPRTREVGMKAVDVSKAAGKDGRVLITFGVVSKQNITLFDVQGP